MKRKKEELGITLIALVVTIIVLIILAGISISMLTGKNGIINQAKDAKEKFEEEGAKEESNLNQIENELNNKTQKQGTLEIIETTEDCIKVKMDTANASEYQFSLDGVNWTEPQNQNEYTFTGLEKVIADANNYKQVSGKQYKVYSKVKFDDGEDGIYGPKVAQMRIEAVSDKEYEYTDLGSEICVTGIKSESFIENPSSMEELDNKIKELQKANVIPNYINGKIVTKISSKIIKQKTNEFINYDNVKIYIYYKESSDATATKILEETISSDEMSAFSTDGGGRHCSIQLPLADTKAGYYKIYGFFGNSYAILEKEYDGTASADISFDIDNNSNALVLPPTLTEIVDSENNNIGSVKEVAKIASLNRFRLGYNYTGDKKIITIYLRNKMCTDVTNIAFLGRNDKSDIKNISIFDNVISNAKQKVIEYYN